MPEKVQSFDNHAKIVPLYHGFVFFAFLINVIWSSYRLYLAPSAETGFSLLVAMALIGLFFYARFFALTVQDRVIRLEMRLRLRDRLPPDLQGRIPEFSVAQLVALRFAGDDELPALAESVLRDNIQDKKTIKKMVKNWQADHQRA